MTLLLLKMCLVYLHMDVVGGPCPPDCTKSSEPVVNGLPISIIILLIPCLHHSSMTKHL